MEHVLRKNEDYTVGWVCALPQEQTAAIAMPEEQHDNLPKPLNDLNAYTLGSISRHNVVVACVPMGKIARPRRDPRDMKVHYGTIASGHQDIEGAALRDRLSKDLGGILCIEMEAAGDSQEHAAAVAAAFAEDLLGDSRGRTPLMVAEEWGHIDVVEFLTEHSFGIMTGRTLLSMGIPMQEAEGLDRDVTGEGSDSVLGKRRRYLEI
ncbi:uncharacterized protein PG986_000159 [Apiospora aurea]|uniref:Ankyrin repeat protein n=1 Tax=Apiospora aurea TaxID=335848 RepID=A0ABR1QTM0_9PEZI